MVTYFTWWIQKRLPWGSGFCTAIEFFDAAKERKNPQSCKRFADFFAFYVVEHIFASFSWGQENDAGEEEESEGSGQLLIP